MTTRKHWQAKVTATLLLALGLWSQAALAVAYKITVDTSSLFGLSGYLDLQFNPGGVTPAATAVVSNLAGDLSPLAVPEYTGAASGVLPSPVTLLNTTQYNDYFQSVQFGNSFSVNVDFSGDFLTQSSLSGTTFALSLYNSDVSAALLTTDPAGSLVSFDLLQSAVSYTTFPQENGAPVATVSAVPLPAAAWLLLSGLVGLGRSAFRRR